MTLGGEIFFRQARASQLADITLLLLMGHGCFFFIFFTAGQDDVQLLWTRLSIDPVLCPVDQRALRAVFCFTFSLNIL